VTSASSIPRIWSFGISTSGETEEVVRLLSYIKRLGTKLIPGRHPIRTLTGRAMVSIDCSVEQEACPSGLMPPPHQLSLWPSGDRSGPSP